MSALTAAPLGLLLATPLVGALLVWVLPARRASAVALASALLTLILALGLLVAFDPTVPGFQWVERHAWIPSLNVHYLVGIDGLSVAFPPLTALLFLAVIAAGGSGAHHLPRLYYSLLLVLETATLGIFCALDLVLFFLFWELTLIPLYFLISLWGIGPHRRYAAVQYSLFMLGGGVPLLFGFLLLAFHQAELNGLGLPQGLGWDYRALLETTLPPGPQMQVFLLLLLGFAVKVPLVPLHTWLAVVSMEGPAPIAALITGLKLGVYGLLRFAVPLAPQAAQDLHWLLAGLGVAGLLYGALAALAQTNLRRMLAFSSLSHVGLVVLGIASLDPQGFQGALFQLANFVLIAGGSFLVTGFLHHRVGSNDALNLGGVASSMPRLAALFLLFGLAGLGVPGTSGFPAELLLLLSVLDRHTGAGLAALFALVVSAAYVLRLYRRAFFGPLRNPAVAEAPDLRPRELAVVGLLALLILAGGLYPRAFLDLTQGASQAWSERLEPAGKSR